MKNNITRTMYLIIKFVISVTCLFLLVIGIDYVNYDEGRLADKDSANMTAQVLLTCKEESIRAIDSLAQSTTANDQDEDTPYCKYGKSLYKWLRDENKKNGWGYNIARSQTRGSLSTLVAIDRPNEESSQSNDKVTNADAECKANCLNIGIAQSDVIYHYLNGGHPQIPIGNKYSDIRAIDRLFPEIFIIKSAAQGEIPALDVLSKKSICIGTIGSGHLITSLNIGNILGINWDNKNYCKDEVGENASGEFAGVYNPSRLDNNGASCSWLKLSDLEVIKSAFQNHPVYGIAKLSDLEVTDTDCRGNRSGKANGKEKCEAGALLIDAILVGHDKLPDKISRAARDLSSHCLQYFKQREDEPGPDRDEYCAPLFDIFSTTAGIREDGWKDERYPLVKHKTIITESLSELRMRSLGNFLTDLYGKVSSVGGLSWSSENSKLLKLPGSVSIFMVEWITLINMIKLILLVSVTGSLVFMILKIYPKLKGASRRKQKAILFDKLATWISRYGWGLGLILSAHVLIGCLIWFAEFQDRHALTNSKFLESGVSGGIYFIIHYVWTGGMMYELHSIWSQMILEFYKGASGIGAILFAFAVTNIAKDGLDQPVAKYNVVVLGWNQDARRLLEELTKQGEKCLIICRDDLKATQYKDEALINCCISQDYDNELQKSISKDLKAIIVLSDETNNEVNLDNLDLNTLRLVVSTEKTLKDQKMENKSIDIIAQANNVENIKAIEVAGAKSVVCAADIMSEILAHSATKLGFAGIIYELINTKSTTNEIYTSKFNQNNEQTYGELLQLEFDRAKENPNEQKQLIGYSASKISVPVINPPLTDKIEYGYYLHYISKSQERRAN